MKKKRVKLNSRVLKSEFRYIEISEFLRVSKAKNHIVYKRLKEFKDKQYTVKDTDLTYRTINHMWWR